MKYMYMCVKDMMHELIIELHVFYASFAYKLEYCTCFCVCVCVVRCYSNWLIICMNINREADGLIDPRLYLCIHYIMHAVKI